VNKIYYTVRLRVLIFPHIALRDWHEEIRKVSIEKYHYRSLTLATR